MNITVFTPIFEPPKPLDPNPEITVLEGHLPKAMVEEIARRLAFKHGKKNPHVGRTIVNACDAFCIWFDQDNGEIDRLRFNVTMQTVIGVQRYLDPRNTGSSVEECPHNK